MADYNYGSTDYVNDFATIPEWKTQEITMPLAAYEELVQRLDSTACERDKALLECATLRAKLRKYENLAALSTGGDR